MTDHIAEMDADRWQRVQHVFHEASALAPEARKAFVETAADGDAAFASQVMTMLDDDVRGDSLLDRGLADVATRLLDDAVVAAIPTGDFGPYTLVRPIGQGGMAVVYLAERTDLGSNAAVKLLNHAWLSPARRDPTTADQRPDAAQPEGCRRPATP